MRKLWLAVFLIVAAAGELAVGMKASATAPITGDEPFYLLTTHSLLTDRDLDLRDEYARREYRRFWDAEVPLWRQMEARPDGRLLSPHDPGLSVLVIPAYAVGGLAGVQRFLVLLWAAAMGTAAIAAARLGTPPLACAVAAVAVGVSAPGVVYASQIYPEGAAALAVACGLLIATGEKPRAGLMFAVLVFLGWLGVKYGAVAAVVFGWWAWRFRDQPKAIAAVVAGAGVAAVHSAWWHLNTFGGLTPYATNVVWAGESTATIVADHLDVADRTYRLYGVFLDARFGLFRWIPIAVVAVCGIGRRTIGGVAVLASAVLVATFMSITIMGWWFPTRPLIAALPALVVLVAAGTNKMPRLSLGLGSLSIGIGAAVVAAARSGSVRLAVDPWDVGLPLPPALLFPDFRSFGVREVAVSLTWAVGLGVLLWVSRRTRRRDRDAPSADRISARPVAVSP